MEQKQPQLTSDKNKIKIGIQNSKAKGPTKTIAKIYQFQELLDIPHICHGRTDDVRVNFFWPV